MSDNCINVSIPGQDVDYKIDIAYGGLSSVGDWASKLTVGSRNIGVISNETVFGLYGKNVVKSLKKVGFSVYVYLIGDGERHKNLKTWQNALSFLSESGISRTDALMALGGGVVGDLAGYVAASYLRGIAMLQVPTTLLAMVDSSVGGKTGVNTTFGKNLVGAFHNPKGVLIDAATLETLPLREITAGKCEMAKHALIAGGKIFDEINSKFVPELSFETLSALLPAQVSFKASIVQNDQFEESGRKDPSSRKILNFGHTFAHALEKVTRYKKFKHGEAVGHGIIFAGILSKKLELLDNNTLELLNDVIRRCGPLPQMSQINPEDIIDSFNFDKKNVANSLQWVLLNGIGKPTLVAESEMPRGTVKNIVRELINNTPT